LLYGLNTVGVSLVADQSGVLHAEWAKDSPALFGIQLDPTVKQDNKPCNASRSRWLGMLTPSVKPGVLSPRTLNLQGTVGAGCAPAEITLRLANLMSSGEMMARGFFAQWQKAGGEVPAVPSWSEGQPSTKARLLFTDWGDSLGQTISDINKLSNNPMARQLYLSLGQLSGPVSSEAPLTTVRSEKVVREWLENNHLDANGMILENGSGLSRRERWTCRGLLSLLSFAQQRPWFKTFVDSLPIAGTDGTMKGRPLPPPFDVDTHASIKTGSLNGVRSMAGYVYGPQGKALVVSMIEHPRALTQGRLIHDALLVWIAGSLAGDSAEPTS
jgi:serine-type D-Ala-D-Ala carboxypeptidase/endopeptidase (penicillin-binding protein 4)